MKTKTGTLLALVGLLSVAASSATTAAVGDLQLSIPFAFTIEGKTLPAGRYSVSRSAPFPGLLHIRGAHAGASLLSQPRASRYAQDAPRLIFHRYQDRYFLREVSFAGRQAFAVPETTDEREASTGRGGKTAPQPEVVSLRASSAR